MTAENNQIALFDVTDAPDPRDKYGQIDLHSYDYYIVAISGGKDSVACLLHLLEMGVPRSKIELWHHRVDGGHDEPRVWDWPVTDAYLNTLARAFEVPLFYSWKVGGITQEMMRRNELTKPTCFEVPGGEVVTSGGTRGNLSTRRMFPAISDDVGKRFCSSYTKIDVGSKALTGQTRFCNKRTLFITGERAAESRKRSKFLRFEPHRTDRRNGKLARHVDAWRPVLDWSESDVWDCIKRWGVQPHPSYTLGYGRCSCAYCIFGNANNFATLREIDPYGFNQMAAIEEELDHTMKQGMSLHQIADAGTRYEAATPERVAVAMSTTYDQPIIVDPDQWELPAGAFGANDGPQ